MYVPNFIASRGDFFTVRRYASTVYAVVMCLSHTGIVSKWLNTKSCK